MALLLGPAVLVPARYAGLLGRLLDSHARASGGLPEGLEGLRKDLTTASAAWQRLQLDPPPTAANGSPEVPFVPAPATLSVMATAEILHCGERNVRDLIRRGTLPASRVGGRWLLTPDDVAALAADRKAS